ncbi:hypothetical protein HK098_008335, partial [Nowakowskiella sp. JEL0407]
MVMFNDVQTTRILERCNSLLNHKNVNGRGVLDYGCVMECDYNDVTEEIHILSKYVKQLFPYDHHEACFLFNEQFIIKPPLQETEASDQTSFAWHYDSQYMNSASTDVPTVSCWVALDEMELDNGTLIVSPYANCEPWTITSKPTSPEEFNTLHCPQLNPSHYQHENTDFVVAIIPRGSVVFMSG